MKKCFILMARLILHLHIRWSLVAVSEKFISFVINKRILFTEQHQIGAVDCNLFIYSCESRYGQASPHWCFFFASCILISIGLYNYCVLYIFIYIYIGIVLAMIYGKEETMLHLVERYVMTKWNMALNVIRWPCKP